RRRGDFELSEEAKVELIEKQSKMQARKRRGSVSIGEAAPDEEIANALRESATCHVHGLNVEGLSVRVASRMMGSVTQSFCSCWLVERLDRYSGLHGSVLPACLFVVKRLHVI
ncbi:unnamed protein product, partial [Prorocentrum cordatum]